SRRGGAEGEELGIDSRKESVSDPGRQSDDSTGLGPPAILLRRECRAKLARCSTSYRWPNGLSGGVAMRKTILTVALVASASPLWAQAAQQAKESDPTHKVAGGISVSGWTGRIDPQAERRGMKIDDAKFSSIANGYHITSG